MEAVSVAKCCINLNNRVCTGQAPLSDCTSMSMFALTQTGALSFQNTMAKKLMTDANN